MAAKIIQIPVGPMENFAYLLESREDKVAAVIDPGWDAQKIIDAATKEDVSIVSVLLTHTHFDHIRALSDLLNLVSVPVYVHELEASALPKQVSLVTTRDGTQIPLGSFKVICHHTPGHTPGGQCFEVENILITGDTLFVDACGRVDLPGSDSQAMKASLQKLASFRDELVMYPGHNYGRTPNATLGEQKRTNPYLKRALAS